MREKRYIPVDIDGENNWHVYDILKSKYICWCSPKDDRESKKTAKTIADALNQANNTVEK